MQLRRSVKMPREHAARADHAAREAQARERRSAGVPTCCCCGARARLSYDDRIGRYTCARHSIRAGA